MVIIEAYEKLKRKARIEKVEPENIEKFRKILREISPAGIARECGIEKERQISYLKQTLFDFFLSPSLNQKKILCYLFRKGKIPTSLRKVHLSVGLCTPYSYHKAVSTKILVELRLIEIINPGWRIVKINKELFKQYWPDIEDWKFEEKKKSKKRAKKGEQMERFFLILLERIKEKSFTPEIVREIKQINRADFKERGWEIKPRSLKNLKERVCKMPVSKFIKNLEMAERKLGFLFTKFYFLLK